MPDPRLDGQLIGQFRTSATADTLGEVKGEAKETGVRSKRKSSGFGPAGFAGVYFVVTTVAWLLVAGAMFAVVFICTMATDGGMPDSIFFKIALMGGYYWFWVAPIAQVLGALVALASAGAAAGESTRLSKYAAGSAILLMSVPGVHAAVVAVAAFVYFSSLAR